MESKQVDEKEERLPIQLAVCRREGFSFYQGPPAVQPTSELSSCLTLAYSPDGKYLASVEKTSANSEFVNVYNCLTQEVVNRLESNNVSHVFFSPCSKYLATFAPQTARGNDRPANLVVYDLSTFQVHMSLHQKEAPNQFSQPLQWTSDEVLCAHIMTNSISVYRGQSQPVRIHLNNVKSFSVSPGTDTYYFATFVPGSKGGPAAIKIFRYPNLNEVVVNKSVFQAEKVEFKWNAEGTHLLALCHTESSQDSYGGGTQLYFMAADGSYSCNVPLNEEGPVQAAEWNPNGREFCVINGKSPFQTTLFSGNDCRPHFEFGLGPVNTIRWSPHGRFLMLGGFRGLSGRMDFWDRVKKKKMGSAEHHAARVYEWAPDGRSFVSAVVHPFRRVDNCFKIWKYNGDLMFSEDVPELYHVLYRPASRSTYPDRPASPPRKPRPDSESSSSSSSSSSAASNSMANPSSASSSPAAPAPAVAPKPVGRYVPPGARGSSDFAERVRQQLQGPVSGPRKLDRTDQVKIEAISRERATGGQERYIPGLTTPAERYIPGLSNQPAKQANNASGNRQQNRSQEQKSESKSNQGNKPKASNQQAKNQAPAPAPAPAQVEQKQEVEEKDPAKRLKAIQKKLRQIEQLKEQRAQGAVLDAGQLEKIASEPTLLRQQAELQAAS